MANLEQCHPHAVFKTIIQNIMTNGRVDEVRRLNKELLKYRIIPTISKIYRSQYLIKIFVYTVNVSRSEAANSIEKMIAYNGNMSLYY